MKEIRKIHVAIEELHLEADRPVDPPLTTIIVAAVMRNPWADMPFTDDLRTEIRRFAAPHRDGAPEWARRDRPPSVR